MQPVTQATLWTTLEDSAARAPDRIAFAIDDRRTSFAAFQAKAERVAAALHDAGIGAGARIAWIGRNSDLYFELLYGALRLGAVVVPVNWRLAAPEMLFIVQDSEARAVVAEAAFLDVAREAAAAATPAPLLIAAETEAHGFLGFTAWRDAPHGKLPDYAAKPEDIAVQLYTSGTTGRAKGVMLTHRNFTSGFAANETAGLSWNQWSADDVAILAMPVSHISGTGWGILTLHHGATCHIQRQFDIELTLRTIAEARVSKIFLVPAALQFLVRHPLALTTDFSSITHMGYGASPIPLPLLRESIARLGCGFVQFYGMTETTGTIVALPPEDHVPEGSPRMRAAGKPLPWVEVRVVDAAGDDVPTGTVGEIITRSGANMAGYWKRPDETAKTIRNGWLHTGDAGYLDADGYVFIHDRVKDMVISGGENVYPAEVENALAEHPAIAEVAVIGVPDAQWGEAVKAIIVLRPGATLDEASLIEWARTRIAGFKAPKSVDFTDTLPRNASGKLLKRELRAPYWAHAQRQVN